MPLFFFLNHFLCRLFFVVGGQDTAEPSSGERDTVGVVCVWLWGSPPPRGQWPLQLPVGLTHIWHPLGVLIGHCMVTPPRLPPSPQATSAPTMGIAVGLLPPPPVLPLGHCRLQLGRFMPGPHWLLRGACPKSPALATHPHDDCNGSCAP